MSYKFVRVRTALRKAGWNKVRQDGSHEIYRHATLRGIVVVAGKDSDTVPVGTLNSILKQSGLTKEDL